MTKHSPAPWGSLIPGQTFVVMEKGGMPCRRETQHRRATIASGSRITVLESEPGSEDVRFLAGREAGQETFTTSRSAFERCCERE